jgi:hypothetical protein
MSSSSSPSGALPNNRRGGMSKSHPFDFELSSLQKQSFNRADLVFHGVDHAGPSYEARVFLNNPDADAETPRTPDEGYAGSFHIFGHGNCFGDVGHCDVNDRGKAPNDFRGPHPLTPARKVVKVTETLKFILQRDGKLKHVKVVPVAFGQPATSEPNPEGFLKYDKIELITYD